MVETKRFYNVTREQFYGVFQNRDFYSGEAEPVAIIEHNGSLMQVEPYQVKFVEETETERKAKAFDEVLDVSSWNAMDVGDAVHSIVREYEEDTNND